jgi:thiamine pyrophosphate-dependent acetolactate synthase large subunit-like protein
MDLASPGNGMSAIGMKLPTSACKNSSEAQRADLGARYDRVMEAFGGKGFLVEDPKDLRDALDEAMNFRGPALVNVVISQDSARKTQEFGWHS